jgi:hypothetical protein
MKSSLFYSCIPPAALLIGCATAYQPAGISGGFTETQLAPDVWRVAFRGNGYTRGERAEDFAMLRSAELTLANGFTHFAFLSSKTGTDVSSYTAPVTATTTGSAYVYGNSISGSSITRYTGGDTTYVSKPTANNTVAMFKVNPNISAMVYDANFICNSLGKKYEVVCNASKK